MKVGMSLRWHISSGFQQGMVALAGISIVSHFLLSVLVPNGYSIGPAMLLLGSLLMLSTGQQWPKLGRADRAIAAAFFLYFLLNLFLILVHGWESSELDRPSRFVLAVFVLPFLLHFRVDPRVFWFSIVASATTLGVFALWQKFYLSVPRVHADINPIYFGNIALALSLMCIPGWLWVKECEERRRWKWLLMGGFAMGLLASLLSGTRGAWISLPLVLPVFFRMLMPEVSKKTLACLVVLFFIVLSSAYVIPTTGVKSRIERAEAEVLSYFQKGNRETSIGLRLEMWRSALLAFQDSPVVGLGKYGYDKHEERLVLEGVVTSAISKFKHLHSEYLETLAKRGLVGFAGLLAIFFVPLWCFLMRTSHPGGSVRALSYAGLLFVLSYMVFSLTNAMLSRNSGVMIYAFSIAILWGMTSSQEKSYKRAIES